jgi:hypothetical protein
MKPTASRSREKAIFHGPAPSGIRPWRALLLAGAMGGGLLVPCGCVHRTPEESNPAASSSMTRSEAVLLAAVAWTMQDPARRSYSIVTDTGSMLPAFDSRSILLLEKLESPPLRGDILHVDQGPGRPNIGHRVRAVKEGWVLMDGDNSPWSDGWFPLDRVGWRVAGILYTNGR